MKLSNILKTLFIAVVVLQFASCQKDDSSGGGGIPAAEGELRATINGNSFVSNTATAELNNGRLLISGESNGQKIQLWISNPTQGEFNFSDVVAGIYTENPTEMPYSSRADGKIKIETFSQTDSIVKGTFNFKGYRIAMDDDGNPVMNNGMPVTEEINITNGSFNIHNLTGTTGGDDGEPGDGDDEPEHEFTARIGNKDFVPRRIKVTDTVVANVPMMRIEASAQSREKIRIDIPKTLGVGTHQMVKISDGTKLIGVYKNEEGLRLTSNPGTLEITEIDLQEGFIKGKFEFTAKDPLGQYSTSVRITRGAFTINFEGRDGANNLLKAKVDGEEYLPEAVLVEREVMGQYPRLLMKTRVGDRAMEIHFPETVRVGTYDFVLEADRGNEVVGVFVPIVGTSITYYSGSGTLTITAIDRSRGIVEGEFHFVAVDATSQDPTEYEVTEGVFNIMIP